MILDILNEIAKEDSTNKKHAILESNKSNATLKRVFKLAYSKRIMFGIKKFPQAGEVSQSYGMLTLDDGLDLLENRLATREVTGNAAIKELSDFIADMKKADVEVIRRVIARDLDIGIGTTIANKVWSKLIPEQPQMLASSYSEKNIAKIKFPAYAQLKADGARCFAEVRGDTPDLVRLLSRAGNEYYGLEKLKLQLIESTRKARETNPEGILVDGELVYYPGKDDSDGLSFLMAEDEKEQTVSLRSESNGIANKSLKNTISEKEADGMKFEVWDFVPLAAYEPSFKSEPYELRLEQLTNACIGFDKIILIETTKVNNLEQARKVYQKYIEMGLEGIILKNTFGIWEDRRSVNQVKFKEVFTIDMKVVGSYVHRKDPTKLGGVMIESECGRIKLNSGSGFTDTTHRKNDKKEWIYIPFDERDDFDREMLWSIRDELPGRIIELECNGWLKSKGRKDGTVSLFLAVVKKWRADKDVANTFEDAFGVDFTEATGIK
ncbi:putative DNA ligase [Erwinia phage FBB1]|nr:putative DNA ligase [Erwinia phage FBB1]